jgi:transcriptional regulator with XRE-family HTH domain
LRTIKEVFASNLKELRKKKELTQEQLASLLSIHHSAYSRWETGKVIPQEDAISQLAKALNIPESRLFLDTTIISPEVAIKVLSDFINKK